MRKADVRRIMLPIHIVLISIWTIIALTLVVMNFFASEPSITGILYYGVMIPSGIGSMMTGMMMFFMFFRKSFQLWIALKIIISMAIMIVMSIWLRRGVESTDSLLVAFPSLIICLLLITAIMLSVFKPRGWKRRNLSKGASPFH